jgi:hypothetical protein
VVSGWVAGGTQTRGYAVDEAFKEAFERDHTHDFEGDRKPRARADTLSPQVNPSESGVNGADRNGSQQGEETPLWTSWRHYGPDAHGDGVHRGPLYNYARAATWWQFARKMEQYANTEIELLLAGNGHASQSLATGLTANGIAWVSVSYERNQGTGPVASNRMRTRETGSHTNARTGIQVPMPCRHRYKTEGHQPQVKSIAERPLGMNFPPLTWLTAVRTSVLQISSTKVVSGALCGMFLWPRLCNSVPPCSRL